MSDYIRFPLGYQKYIDYSYGFKILSSYSIESCPRIIIENRLHEISPNEPYPLSECVYFKLLVGGSEKHFFFNKKTNADLFEAGENLRESKISSKRLHKYITLYHVYELITSKDQRNLEILAVRHSLSHSSKNLTRPNVVAKLKEMFGSLKIDFSSRRQTRVFYMIYWKMLIETDEILFNLIIERTEPKTLLQKDFIYIN